MLSTCTEALGIALLLPPGIALKAGGRRLTCPEALSIALLLPPIIAAQNNGEKRECKGEEEGSGKEVRGQRLLL